MYEDLQNALLKQYVVDPENLEKEIAEISALAAGQIIFSVNGTATFEFRENKFIARSRESIIGSKRCLQLVISNETTRSLVGNKYIPYTVSCEVDNDFSLLDNYKAVFSAFLRHLTGTDQAEVLEE